MMAAQGLDSLWLVCFVFVVFDDFLAAAGSNDGTFSTI